MSVLVASLKCGFFTCTCMFVCILSHKFESGIHEKIRTKLFHQGKRRLLKKRNELGVNLKVQKFKKSKKKLIMKDEWDSNVNILT